MKRIVFILTIVALGMTSCNKIEIHIPGEEAANGAKVYHVSIPASMGTDTKAVSFNGESGITSQFLTTDKVYVYNVTKGAWAWSDVGNGVYAYLQPSDLKNDGKSCTLEGDLAFYKNNNGWVAVAIDASDTYELYYNLVKSGQDLFWNYASQDGSINRNNDATGFAGVTYCDYAKAEGVTLTENSGTLTVDGSVRFQNIGSMFRQRLSFTKGGSPMSPAPTELRYMQIYTEHNILGMWGVPHTTFTTYGNAPFSATSGIVLGCNQSVMDAHGDVYFALTFDNTDLEASDKMYFTVEDYEGNIYYCEKAMPAGGFQNSKYYYGELVMEWQSQRTVPTVTASNSAPILPSAWDLYVISDGATISGNSVNFFCQMDNSATTVTLAGGGTATIDYYNPFLIGSNDKDLTVTLASDYTISVPSFDEGYAICATGNGNLKLATTGGSHTLTVTAKTNTYGGLNGANYTTCATEGDNIPALAAAGCTVTLTSATDNGGTYTFVYTVAPLSAPAGVVAVDFGLPSGTLWASCNVGATSPEQFGDYFAWGETAPYYAAGHSNDGNCYDWVSNSKEGYNWTSYPYATSNDNTKFNKYTASEDSYATSGTADGRTVLLAADDAATANWGSEWCTPTKEQWQELQNNTTYEWVSNTVIKIYKSSDPSKYILLPTAGFWRNYSYLYQGTQYGFYWTSSLYYEMDDHYPYNITSYDPRHAWFVMFSYSGGIGWYGDYPNAHDEDERIYRCNGMPIRPVRAPQNP